MNFLPSRIWLMFVAGVLLALPAGAEDTVQFSKPADLEAMTRANSFMPAPSERPRVIRGASAPLDLFSGTPDNGPLPAPVMRTPLTDSMKEALDRRDNWTLLTPAEILGVPTTEKILGRPDANGDDKLSPDERFLTRLQRERQAGNPALSALRPEDARLLRNDKNASPSARRDNRFPGGESAQTPPGSPKYFSPFLNGAAYGVPDADGRKPNSLWGAATAGPSPWVTDFTQANQLPPSPEQLADMERFHALLEPSSPADKTPAFALPAPNPNMQVQPSFNPAGNSYVPVRDNVSRPQGLTPLSGLTRPQTTPVSPSAPTQLPPWLQAASPSSAFPQRKF